MYLLIQTLLIHPNFPAAVDLIGIAGTWTEVRQPGSSKSGSSKFSKFRAAELQTAEDRLSLIIKGINARDSSPATD